MGASNYGWEGIGHEGAGGFANEEAKGERHGKWRRKKEHTGIRQHLRRDRVGNNARQVVHKPAKGNCLIPQPTGRRLSHDRIADRADRDHAVLELSVPPRQNTSPGATYLHSVEITKRIPTAMDELVVFTKPRAPMAMRQKNMNVMPLM